ncbi:four helix bundle protein [Puniceicoccaceae bacterium]|nr:four helix bundle protein [Puniceicoccaceae bacterium]
MSYKQADWNVFFIEEANSNYDLEERLLDFSVRTIRLCRNIENSPAGNHVSKQLLRSSTSPLANHGEAQGAESAKDFVHKLGISVKERRETLRWLKLVKRVPLVIKPEILDELIDETDQLIRIFFASIKTAKLKSTDK